jgi:hypothetical protein
MNMAPFSKSWFEFYNKMPAVPDDERTTTTISEDGTPTQTKRDDEGLATITTIGTAIGSLKVSTEIGYLCTMNSGEPLTYEEMENVAQSGDCLEDPKLALCRLAIDYSIAANKARGISRALLGAIVDVHNVTKGRGKKLYPNDLQNLLLTSSRVVDAITVHLQGVSAMPSLEKCEPLTLIKEDLDNAQTECMMICTHATTPTKRAMEDELKLWKSHERRLCTKLLPLLVYYKHIKW